MYKLKTSKKFDTQYKKLSFKDKKLTFDIIQKLLKGETLDEKYKDHKLKGKFAAYRECHIKPDLLLIYQKQDEILTLTCVNVGSHGKLFKG